MKSVISYTLEKCSKCMKCLKICPTEAITIVNSRVVIDHEKCTNCGKCLSSCYHQGLQAKGSTLYDIANYDYTVCIVPSALISDCKNQEEAQELFYAIKCLGFDEVVDITDIEGQVYLETIELSRAQKGNSFISSFCPVINELLAIKYPTLLPHLMPLEYPSEIAAKTIRKRLSDKGRVGIFNCCECVSKLHLAKYPYGDQSFEVDHALSIVDIFPKIKANFKKGKMETCFNREGLQSVNPSMMMHRDDILVADGFDKVMHILELAEFNQLSEFCCIMLFPCFNGCLGGSLLWGNSYIMKTNIQELCPVKDKEIATLPLEELYGLCIINKTKELGRFKERFIFFNKVNEQLEKLPGYDCGACGYPSCRIVAEQIAMGKQSLSACRILNAMEVGDNDESK